MGIVDLYSKRQEEDRRIRDRQNFQRIENRNNRVTDKLLQKQRIIEPPKKTITRTQQVIVANPPGSRTLFSTQTVTTTIPNNFNAKSRLIRRSEGYIK